MLVRLFFRENKNIDLIVDVYLYLVCYFFDQNLSDVLGFYC